MKVIKQPSIRMELVFFHKVPVTMLPISLYIESLVDPRGNISEMAFVVTYTQAKLDSPGLSRGSTLIILMAQYMGASDLAFFNWCIGCKMLHHFFLK